MREDEHHQLELERQQMTHDIAEEARFAILMSTTLGITDVTETIGDKFYVSAYGRVFEVSVKEM